MEPKLKFEQSLNLHNPVHSVACTQVRGRFDIKKVKTKLIKYFMKKA
jgi:hypothetical protein